MNGISGGLAECSDIGIGSDDEFRFSGAVVEVGCNIDELVADVDDGSGLIVPPKTVSNVPPAAETNVPPSVASSRSFFFKHSANPVSTFKGIQRRVSLVQDGVGLNTK